jgi:hypothetical protein
VEEEVSPATEDIREILFGSYRIVYAEPCERYSPYGGLVCLALVTLLLVMNTPPPSGGGVFITPHISWTGNGKPL